MLRYISLLFLLAVSCERAVVYVSVDGLTPEISGLRVTVSLDGIAGEPQRFTQHLDALSVRLPMQRTGVLSLFLEGEDAAGCVRAEKRVGDLPILDFGLHELRAVLEPQDPKKCPGLTIELVGNGSGTVASEPAGLVCDASTCVGSFAAGTQLRLSPVPNATSSFAGWSSPCEASSDCSLTLARVNPPLRAKFNRGFCSEDSWCWSYPQPQGNHLNGVCADGAGGYIAVGDAGTILRYDGKGWEPMLSPTTERLQAITCASPDRVLAVGDSGTLLHLEQGIWKQLAVQIGTTPLDTNLWSIFRVTDHDLLIGGENGLLLRGDLGDWKQVPGTPSSTMYGIWADEQELFIRGGWHVYRSRGASWDKVTPGSGSTFALSGLSSDKLFALTNEDAWQWHTDSEGWSPLNIAMLEMNARVLSAAPSRVLLGGDAAKASNGLVATWTQGRWSEPTPVPTATMMNAIAGQNDDAFIVGQSGYILGEQKQSWQMHSYQVGQESCGPTGDVRSGYWYLPAGVWLGGPAFGFAACYASVKQWDGHRWTKAQIPALTGPVDVDGFGSGAPGEVFAVGGLGSGYILRWSGTRFETHIKTGSTLTSIASDQQQNMVAAGLNGALWRYRRGETWTKDDSGTLRSFADVWVGAQGVAVVVGDQGVARRWDPAVSKWESIDHPDGIPLSGVLGLGADEFLAVGNHRVLRWKGKWLADWEIDVASAVGYGLQKIAGNPSGAIFVSGDGRSNPGSSVLCQLDLVARTCNKVRMGTTIPIVALATLGREEAVVLLNDGGILRRKGL